MGKTLQGPPCRQNLSAPIETPRNLPLTPPLTTRGSETETSGKVIEKEIANTNEDVKMKDESGKVSWKRGDRNGVAHPSNMLQSISSSSLNSISIPSAFVDYMVSSSPQALSKGYEAWMHDRTHDSSPRNNPNNSYNPDKTAAVNGAEDNNKNTNHGNSSNYRERENKENNPTAKDKHQNGMMYTLMLVEIYIYIYREREIAILVSSKITFVHTITTVL